MCTFETIIRSHIEPSRSQLFADTGSIKAAALQHRDVGNKCMKCAAYSLPELYLMWVENSLL